MKALTTEVRSDIRQLLNTLPIETPLNVNGECCCGNDADDCDCTHMTITVSTTDGDRFGYQTGDNSYTGGAYGGLHWSVVYLSDDGDRVSAADEIIDQLNDMLADS